MDSTLVTWYGTKDETQRILAYRWMPASERSDGEDVDTQGGGSLVFVSRTTPSDVWNPPRYVATMTLDEAREWTKNELTSNGMDCVEESDATSNPTAT